MTNKFDRPRGTRDFRPDDMAKRRWLESVFRETFRRAGYREIQTPTFEHTALFMAKSGPNVVDEIYAFQDKAGREICLRPELTAPVLRFFVNELSNEPKPLKLYYHGPCFRYEEPQEGRYREFWQFGLELIGPEGPDADAEVISQAVHALKDAGLRGFVLHVGHIGVLRALMGAFDAPDDKKAALYRKIDKDDAELGNALREVAPAQVADAIEAVARHRRTLQSGDARAVDAFFEEARGAIAPALALAPALAPVLEKALAELRATVTLLHALSVDALELDLGVARGLDYYTGMVFELEAPQLGAQKQIGGGGAYALAELFGGERVGSCGFGLGFDRILLALEKENAVPALPPVAQVYVATLGDAARPTGLQIATSLRREGMSVEVDLMGRSLSKALTHAGKLAARVVLIVGEKDLAQGVATLRDMRSGEQKRVPLAEVANAVRSHV